jgi:hypothetical protein
MFSVEINMYIWNLLVPLEGAGTNSPTLTFIFVKPHNICHVSIIVNVRASSPFNVKISSVFLSLVLSLKDQ